MRALDFQPVRRANPNSTLRGLLTVELANGIIVASMSVLSSGRAHWVQIPARLRLDPVTGVPIGVGKAARWDDVVLFRDTETRRRFSDECIAALLRTCPEALDEPAASSAA